MKSFEDGQAGTGERLGEGDWLDQLGEGGVKDASKAG